VFPIPIHTRFENASCGTIRCPIGVRSAAINVIPKPLKGARTIPMVAENCNVPENVANARLSEDSPVSVNTKRVFYVKQLAHSIFAEILGRRGDVRLDRLENDAAEAEAIPIVSAAHVYQVASAQDDIARRFHVDRALIARIPNVLIVSTNGVGYDTVDVKACTDAGILVVNQAGGNREAVAEHALGMLLSLSKRIGETNLALRRGQLTDRIAYMGRDVFRKTIGIIGLGNVGSRMAELCGGLFAMRVLAYDPYLDAAVCRERGAENIELNELLRRSDYVLVSCPLTAETRGMIGAVQFALMRPHAYFITIARAHIHDEAALAEALRRKQIAGAGLDVWATEPPPSEHPLLQFDNVMASAHAAGVTTETRFNMGKIAAEQVLDALDGKPVARKVNPEVWPTYARRFARQFGFAPEQ
jgi:D-3-phosphoglycerate dehydrogenase / 2-oxoglutarate reductase